MQIVHKDGVIEFRGMKAWVKNGETRSVYSDVDVLLSEAEVERLMDRSNGSDLAVALRAAKDFNRSAKLNEIAALEAKLKELKGSVK